MRLSNPSAGLSIGTKATVTATIVDATGMEPRRFRTIRKLQDGSIQLELAGSVSKRFGPFYSIFQVESSDDFKSWEPLGLIGHPNNSEAPMLLTQQLQTADRKFYRLVTTPLISADPPPTGPFAVGVTRRTFVDPARRNRYRISTNAAFAATIWYPAVPLSGRLPANALEIHVGTAARDYQIPDTTWMDEVVRFSLYSTSDLPLRSGDASGWPVVTFSHGAGGYRIQDQVLSQNLASHGFIVIALDHFDVSSTLLPNGNLYVNLVSLANIPIAEATLKDRVRDLVVVMDQLDGLNKEDPMLRTGLDLSRVAAVGFSWGAETAAEFCRVDSRCQAAVSLDWGGGRSTDSVPEFVRLGLQEPSLMLNASNNAADYLFRKADTDAYWVQISSTVHGDFVLEPWYSTSGDSNSAAKMEAVRTIQAYALSFLKKYLKGEDDPLLDGPSPDYPRVSSFRKK